MGEAGHCRLLFPPGPPSAGLLVVGPEVLPNISRLYEGLGADWTGVFPLPCVSGCVSRQMRFLHESLGENTEL